MILTNVKLRRPKVLFEKIKFEGTEGIIYVEYYITEKSAFNQYDEEDLVLYGIEVRKMCTDSISNLSDKIPIEISTYLNISSNKTSVTDLIHILAKNCVTPVTLKYNLEDMCGIYF